MVSFVLRMLVPFSLMFTARMPLVLAVFRLALTELIVKAYGARHVTFAVPAVITVVSSESAMQNSADMCAISAALSASMDLISATVMSLGFALMLWNVISSSSVFSEVLSHRFLTAIGRWSYSLYLWHWPILVAFSSDRSSVLTHGNIFGWSDGHARMAVLVCSVIAASASFYCIERPFLRLKTSAATWMPSFKPAPARASVPLKGASHADKKCLWDCY